MRGFAGLDLKSGINPNQTLRTPGASNYYSPRVRAFLTVPVAGTSRQIVNDQKDSEDVVHLEMRVRKLRIEFNDHNMADTASIEAEYLDVGQDPRLLANATVEIYIGDITNKGTEILERNRENLKFVGIAVKIARAGSEEEGLTLKIDFHDYTEFFLESKHYPPENLPKYDMTLSEVWALICDNTGYIGDDNKIVSSVKQLRTNIHFDGGAQDTPLSVAVAERLKKVGKVPIHPDKDSWAVWQTCCLMVGMISFISLDQVIVTTATNLYTSEDPLIFSWGGNGKDHFANIHSIHEDRNSTLVRKGIRISSYDPLTNKDIEAFWPPLRDRRVLKKTITAKALDKKDPAAVTKAEDLFDFYYPAVTNPDRLLEIAKRVYEEKARQELEGTLSTVEMQVIRKSGTFANILNLRAGDTIRVEFDPENKTLLKSLGSRTQQLDYLVERGYTPAVAVYLVDNLYAIDRWPPEFLVKRVVLELDSDESEGNFNVEINYLNHISIDGATDPGF